MDKKLFLSRIIYFLHVLIIVIVLAPFFCKPGEWLKYIILIIIIIIMSWHDGNNECAFTALEHRLLGIHDTNRRAPFFSPILNKFLNLFNRKISDKKANNFNYLLFLISILVSFINYLLYRKISLIPKTRYSKITFYIGIFLLMFYILNILL